MIDYNVPHQNNKTMDITYFINKVMKKVVLITNYNLNDPLLLENYF